MSRRHHRHPGCRVAAAAGSAFLLILVPSHAAGTATAHQDRQTAGEPRFVVGPNLRASANAAGGNRNEAWIATSPRNPDFVIGVSQIGPTGAPLECATMLSRNGGRTWRETRLPGQETGCFDPMVLATRDGRVYVLHALMLQRGPSEGRPAAPPRRLPDRTIRVWSSDDEGVTWSEPTDLACPLAPDHPRMAVDESGGPHHGRLYVAWNEGRDTLLRGRFHVFLHYSDDGGRTFSDPVLVTRGTGGKLVTTEPVVLSDGTLLVTYYQFFGPMASERNDRKPFFVIRSTDGGTTFGPPEEVIDIGTSAWRHLLRDFIFAFALPVVAVDSSPSSPFHDRIYVVWDDVRTGRSSIWLRWSADGGRTWAEPVRVNDNGLEDGPPDLRMTPVVAVNPDGLVGIAWYDRRDDPSRRCWHQYFTASDDGGRSFLPNVALSTAPSCPEPNLAPTVHVSNVAEHIDESRPDEAHIAALPQGPERSALQREAAIDAALEQAYGSLAPRIRIGFDTARNAWPGHYSGLAAGADGAFHALWADRRGRGQQLFTTRVEVVSGDPEAAPSKTAATDLTGMVALIASPASFNEGAGTATFGLQLRNVSDQVIHAPLSVLVSTIGESPAGPTVELIDVDAGGSGVGATWDFSDLMGSTRRLLPGDITGARTVVVRVDRETGLDGIFGFEVRGHVRTGGAPSAAHH